jgi:monoamine oxidase
MFSPKLSIAITALGLISFSSSALPQTVDVAIVGGGLAGLSAAKDLVAAGKTVLVLEARDRVGGRVFNAQLSNGGITEVGAEFVGPTQDRVLALIASLGLKTFDTYVNGSSVLWMNDTRTVYAPDPAIGGLPPIDLPGLVQAGTAKGILNDMASELDVSAPWNHPKAIEWDSISFGTWLDTITPLPSARFLFDLASTSLFSAESPEISLLYVVAYIAAAGNETNVGTLDRLIATTDGAQEKRVEGGTQMIAIKLAERLGSRRIALNAPVRSIRQTASYYQVNADGLEVKASSVVIAMSPPLAARISYGPLLPASRDQLCQKMPMGSIAKAIAVYETPFWRTDGLTAQALSDSGLVSKLIFFASASSYHPHNF